MEQTIQTLEAKRSAARRGYLVCAALGVALVVMLGTHQYTRALAVAAVTAVCYFLLARPDIRGFADAYRKANVQTAMGRWLEDAAYHGKAGTDPEKIRAARLLPVKEGNGCITYHRITGRGAGAEWELCDVSFQAVSPGAEGRNQFLSGCWITGELEQPTGQWLRMVSRKIATDALLTPYFLEKTDYRPMTWEDKQLDQEFTSFAREGQLPEPSPAFRDRLLELVEKTPGAVALALDDERLTVMLCHRFVTTGDPGVRDAVTPERLEQQALPELEQVLELAKALRPPETGTAEQGVPDY